MMNIHKYFPVLFLVLFSCAPDNNSLVQTEEIISGVKDRFAPDKRVAWFNIEAEQAEGTLVLRGESNLPKAVDSLKSALSGQGISFTDSIRMLPAEALEGKSYGVVNISVANLRSAPKHSAELTTQAILGTPLNVLKKDGGWYLVQTPDDYIAWVDWGGLVTVQKAAFDAWRTAEKIVYLEPYGFAYEEADANSATVTDLVSGNILELSGEKEGFYEVKYPDGNTAFVEKSYAQPYEEWVASLNPTGQSLVNTSTTLMGVPYLWGGTSFKGVDCSGFTKTVYFLNGMVIPRDASQQIHTGQLIDSTRSFEKLLPGDLLFFGRAATDSTAERVIHVGMWIGDNKFIHSSGKVHISSMDSSADDFDQYNYDRYLRTKRLLQQKDEEVVHLSSHLIF